MKNKVILLVEDDPKDVELTLRALKKTGILAEVVVAGDGVAALDYLFGHGAHTGRNVAELPSIVLLDQKLPKLDGIDVLRRIRAKEHTKLLPVIILTSSSEDKDRLASYGSGANSFVRKPVESDAFADAVRQLGLYWLLINQAAAD